jgi:hypothetical protein
MRIDSVAKKASEIIRFVIPNTSATLEQTLAIILPSAMPTVYDSNVCKVGPQGVGETLR